MLLTTDKEERKRSSPWLLMFPAALALMVGVVALLPVFASRGKVGRVRWYTQVTPSAGAPRGLTPIQSPWSRGWVLRVGDWHWFLGLDHK